MWKESVLTLVFMLFLIISISVKSNFGLRQILVLWALLSVTLHSLRSHGDQDALW